jgi:hypothetical protein
MPNYNDVNDRNTAISGLPRMIFQLPNSESGTALSAINPVFFCQSGCSIEYHFSNITSCTLDNDGNKFMITPTDTQNINYILWNGTDINSGESMTQFNLQEIYFTAPAKDYIGTDNSILNQSIQYYFVFVNQQFNNLMICISIIGNVNNLGNSPKSNGFIMLQTLSSQIPVLNNSSQLNSLSNFNLGTLIPPNKPFFNTLVSNNIQYIIVTEIVDIPIDFFSNMNAIVNGSSQIYTQKLNRFLANTPVNPSNTILFYNENSPLLDDNSAYVCNSNCDLVPGKQINPTIGGRNSSNLPATNLGTGPNDPNNPNNPTVQNSEECEVEEVWSGTLGAPGAPGAPGVSGTIKTPDEIKKIENEQNSTTTIAITVSFGIIMFVLIAVIGYRKYLNTGSLMQLSGSVIGSISILICFTVGCVLYVLNGNSLGWVPYLIGCIVWFICFGLILYSDKNASVSSFFGINQSIIIPTNGSSSSSSMKSQKQQNIIIPQANNPSFFRKLFGGPSSASSSSSIVVPSSSSSSLSSSPYFSQFPQSQQKTIQRMINNPSTRPNDRKKLLSATPSTLKGILNNMSKYY